MVHIIAKPDKRGTEVKNVQLSTQLDGERTPSAEYIEKGALLDKFDESKCNDGVFRAIYSSQSEIKKNTSVDTQLVKDQVRASLEHLSTIQCKIRTEDSLTKKNPARVGESGISVSNYSTDPAEAIRKQLDLVQQQL